MHIRQERRGDEVAIHDLTAVAFADHPHGDGSEPIIVKRLRDAGALQLSLVAEEAGEILGHVAFSPVTISGEDLGWLGLGPVSVLPARQGQGIGSALIRAGRDLKQWSETMTEQKTGATPAAQAEAPQGEKRDYYAEVDRRLDRLAEHLRAKGMGAQSDAGGDQARR